MKLCEWWSGANLNPFIVVFRIFQPEYVYRFCELDRSREDTGMSNLVMELVTHFKVFLEESLTNIALKLESKTDIPI